MDLKEPGNYLYQVGLTENEMGGSHFALIHALDGGQVPKVDAQRARRTFAALHEAIRGGLVRACHDLSEGGLAVAAAEAAFAGNLGARVELAAVPNQMDTDDARPVTLLFSESNTRFLCEVRPRDAEAFENRLGDLPCARIGQVTRSDKLEILDTDNQTVIHADIESLKEAWLKPLAW
jgi:phosphoribosylformylglycinamidine synthase